MIGRWNSRMSDHYRKHRRFGIHHPMNAVFLPVQTCFLSKSISAHIYLSTYLMTDFCSFSITYVIGTNAQVNRLAWQVRVRFDWSDDWIGLVRRQDQHN